MSLSWLCQLWPPISGMLPAPFSPSVFAVGDPSSQSPTPLNRTANGSWVLPTPSQHPAPDVNKVLPSHSTLNAAGSHTPCRPRSEGCPTLDWACSHWMMPDCYHRSLHLCNLWPNRLLPQRLPHCEFSFPILCLHLVLRFQSDPLLTSFMMP